MLSFYLRRLFWLARPHLLLWLLEMVIVVNAAVLTLCLFFLAFGDKMNVVHVPLGWLWLISFLTVVMAAHLGWVVIPEVSGLQQHAAVVVYVARG